MCVHLVSCRVVSCCVVSCRVMPCRVCVCVLVLVLLPTRLSLIGDCGVGCGGECECEEVFALFLISVIRVIGG